MIIKILLNLKQANTYLNTTHLLKRQPQVEHTIILK